MAKTIVFCDDIDHAERMRKALANCNRAEMEKDDRYVMKITGDDKIGKAQLENFIDPKQPYPVIATTSELMTTGVNAKTCKLVVLDQNIQSMTKFKQIIGRGTRIEERYDKTWFTILDFKNATKNFEDPAFDGVAEKVYERKESDFDKNNPLDDEHETSHSIGEESASYSANEETTTAKQEKYYVKGVDVQVAIEHVKNYSGDGTLVTESFKDHTRKNLSRHYTSLDDFVRKWQAAERKQVIIDELAQQGVIWEGLMEEVGKDLDPFDMICHVVYDQPPLTRKERAENVKKRNYFTKYEGAARTVLENLLEKYADEGVHEIENIQVLKITPFDSMGRPMEIIKNSFGDRQAYQAAIQDLENEIYQDLSQSA